MAEVENRRLRRTPEKIFLDALAELCKKQGKEFIANSEVKQYLNWTQEKYDDTWNNLVKTSQIRRAHGRGGKVGLAKQNLNQPVKLFISYCHEDDALVQIFKKHIGPIKYIHDIFVWDDKAINPGQDIDKSIIDNLNNSDIIILLLSIDYLNSYYCMSIEFKEAIERRYANKNHVVPVILRDCMWKHTPLNNTATNDEKLGSIKALPNDAVPVTKFSNQDEAFCQVAEGLLKVVKEITKNR